MRRLLAHAAALALYALLLCWVLQPVEPATQVLGALTDDTTMHLSVAQWVAADLSQGVLLPTHCRWLLYPDGGTMLPADLVGNLLGTLLAPRNAVLAHNLTIFGALLASCWSMFWLVRRETRGLLPALLAGLLFGVAPLHLAHAYNGTTELLHAWALPLCLGAGLHLVRRARQRRWDRAMLAAVGLAGLSLWAAFVGSFYYGVFASMLLVLLGLPSLLRAHRWHAVLGIAAAGGLFLLLASPLLWGVLQAAAQPDYLLRPIAGGGDPAPVDPFTQVDLAYLFGARPTYNDYHHPVYLGLVPTALMLTALLRRGSRRAALGMAAGAAVFFVLALGPTFCWDGGALLFLGATLPTPVGLLSEIVPGFRAMAFPYRYLVMVQLLLVFGGAQALVGLPWRRAAITGLVVVAGLGWLGELVWLAGPPLPLQRSPLEAPGPVVALATQDSVEAVLDLPFPTDSIPAAYATKRYLLLQHAHQRPVVYASGRALPSFIAPSVPGQPGFQLLEEAGRPADQPLHQAAFHALRAEGYPASLGVPGREERVAARARARCVLGALLDRQDCDEAWVREALDGALFAPYAIVLHTDQLARGSRLRPTLRALFGAPTDSGDGVEVYDGAALERRLRAGLVGG